MNSKFYNSATFLKKALIAIVILIVLDLIYLGNNLVELRLAQLERSESVVSLSKKYSKEQCLAHAEIISKNLLGKLDKSSPYYPWEGSRLIEENLNCFKHLHGHKSWSKVDTFLAEFYDIYMNHKIADSQEENLRYKKSFLELYLQIDPTNSQGVIKLDFLADLFNDTHDHFLPAAYVKLRDQNNK